MTSFGVYFYPWYNAKRWAHNERCHRHTSLNGRYDSLDKNLVEWQTQKIVESGFDYVVIETVMPSDWCYGFMMDATGQVIHALREAGLSWSFMVDAFVTDNPASHSQMIMGELDKYKSNGWLNGVISTRDKRPEIFTFGAHPQTVGELAEYTAAKFNYHHVVWLKHWGVPNDNDDLPVFDAFNCHVRAFGGNATYRDVLVPMGYIPFWQPTDQIFCANGFATACPGYDDLLLKRKPQLAPVIPRENGETFRQQLMRAGDSGADRILVYGWNEYFEATTIEPSLEFSDQYLNIMKEYIHTTRVFSGE